MTHCVTTRASSDIVAADPPPRTAIDAELKPPAVVAAPPGIEPEAVLEPEERAWREGNGSGEGHGGVRHPRQVGRVEVHPRSEEHTSELQSLMRISSSHFSLKKNKLYKKSLL